MVQVPSFAVHWIQEAAHGTGLPYAVVACQVNAESGFNAGAVSPAGAEGPYQFLPSTFQSVANGSPFNWSDSTIAYIVYMNELLHQFHGDVRIALAAYNAGPGNYGAGLGYADGILSCAGSGDISTGPSGFGPAVQTTPPIPNVQPDDWSWYILRTARHMEDLSGSAQYWANYIGRL
jgi:Transglycosylase SLT domain